MPTKSNELEVTHKDGMTVIRFTRPAIRNPLSLTVLDQIEEVVDSLADETMMLVFTGQENSFASGADLREIAGVTSEAAPEFARRGQRIMGKVANLPQRTLAAINGFCFGGALDLALACGERIATPNAKFAHPGTGLGIITGWGGTQRLPRLIGMANAFEMFFTAEAIDAERALRIGLVDQIVDDRELLNL